MRLLGSLNVAALTHVILRTVIKFRGVQPAVEHVKFGGRWKGANA